MNRRALIIILAAIPALSGCAEDFRLADPLPEDGPLCSGITGPDTVWRAGCATRQNLAALAVKPDDLFIARPETPRDAMRRDRIFNSYGRPEASGWQNLGAQSASATGNSATTGAAE